MYSVYNGGMGGSFGFGIMSDSVYVCSNGDLILTTSWGVVAGFEHHWNPHWQTSVYGAYVARVTTTCQCRTLLGRASRVCWALR